MSLEMIRKRENCLKELITRYKTLGSGIINHVSEKHNFDVHKANMALMELTGALIQKPEYTREPRIENPNEYVSVEEIEECIDDVLTGARVLIILRGLPGSGKSYLAKSILRACYSDPDYKFHIHSSDNFFMRDDGKYMFDARQLGEAHGWNQKNVEYRMHEGFSPLVVDNTNTQIWEMRSYLGMAVEHGYKIRVLEVNTRWCFNCNDLTKRNQHNVPKQTIKSMLERYEMGVTAEKLLETYRYALTYQKAPMLRRCPPFAVSVGPIESHNSKNPDLSLPKSKKKERNGASTPPERNEVTVAEKTPTSSPFTFNWDTDIGEMIKSWNTLDSPKSTDNVTQPKKPDTSEAGTNTTIMDIHRNDENSKVLYGRSRSITDTRRPMADNKPGTLDKGCSTHDLVCADRNEDIKKLIDIFQSVPPMYIRDMYDDCKGDFDMTFEIFLEDNKDYSHLPYTLDNVVSNTNEAQECDLTKHESVESLNEASALPQVTPKKFERSVSTGAIKKYSVTPLKKESTSPEMSEDENTCGTPISSDSDFDSQSTETRSENESVELNLGEMLVKRLEKEFGDPSHNFPDGFQPVVQVPKALGRQLYAFYVESVYQQMEAQQSILENLVKEDEAFARKLYEEEIGVIQKLEGFEEIMNEQAAMKIHKKQMPALKTPNDLATQLTKRKLFESFPSVDQSVIVELYHANSLDYKQTVDDLITSVGAISGLNGNIREPPISPSTIQELETAQKDSKQAVNSKEEEEKKTPEEYRAEAEYYLKKRNELYQKAQEHYNRGQKEVAQFYSQLAQQQTQYYDMANNRAASVFLDENSKQLQNMNTLDLHYLFVKEAVSALDVFIDSKIDLLQGKGSQDLLIITGRGKRSMNGVSKIRPAVIRRLEARKIKYHKMNPGLLKIKVKWNTPVTNDL